MARYLLPAGVLLGEIALRSGARPAWPVLALYGLAVLVVILVRIRWASVAFVCALALTSVAGPGYLLLPWAGWYAGRSKLSRTQMVAVAGAGVGAAAGQVVARSGEPRSIPLLVFTFLGFVVLPVVAGRYVAEHRRLVVSLAEHNRRLEQGQAVLAEQERLRERLRIARDVHDSLGHRLSLVSVQAAALEVAGLPPRQRAAVEQLAGSARAAMDELYDLIGTLRADTGSPGSPARGITAIPSLVRACGLPIELRERGPARSMAAGCEEAAYRVVEEGLTNAAKHAPGRPVRVELAWELDALLVTVANGTPPAGPGPVTAGHGLLGLSERVTMAGGFLDHRLLDGEFRLVAMLPLPVGPGTGRPARRGRLLAVGLTVALLMFGLLSIGTVAGVSG
ncbi:sensor histidine kinase [Hamadaea tsunoensis]|uniref:sensor histidine kinase n=1 Tax=Hamadaea tsunoensis TaxID=53368 RepID=UPI0006847DE1|nr:histidine kinase [Hamadaea tsunoensis]